MLNLQTTWFSDKAERIHFVITFKNTDYHAKSHAGLNNTMAPHAEIDEVVNNHEIVRLPAPERPTFSSSPPRLVIIGAGNRGTVYAAAIQSSTNGILAAVVEPNDVKRRLLGRKYIWGKGAPSEGQEFKDWPQFVAWELQRRKKESSGESVPEGVDGVLVCVQDQMHKEVVLGLAPLELHIMCEKPLATSLDDCVAIYRSLLSGPDATQTRIFSIGHVLRYSPHNMLLRKLLVEEQVIGEVMSVNHTEPVGWWHFTHSYVRLVYTPSLRLKVVLIGTVETGGKSQPQHRVYWQSHVMIWMFYFGFSPLPHLDRPNLPISQARSALPDLCNISTKAESQLKLEVPRTAVRTPLSLQFNCWYNN